MKEFLCTYTWGPESYEREICERFGILTERGWVQALGKNGFSVETVTKSKEEYEKFLSDRVVITNADGTPYEYPYMTVILKAVKR